MAAPLELSVAPRGASLPACRGDDPLVSPYTRLVVTEPTVARWGQWLSLPLSPRMITLMLVIGWHRIADTHSLLP